MGFEPTREAAPRPGDLRPASPVPAARRPGPLLQPKRKGTVSRAPSDDSAESRAAPPGSRDPNRRSRVVPPSSFGPFPIAPLVYDGNPMSSPKREESHSPEQARPTGSADGKDGKGAARFPEGLSKPPLPGALSNVPRVRSCADRIGGPARSSKGGRTIPIANRVPIVPLFAKNVRKCPRGRLATGSTPRPAPADAAPAPRLSRLDKSCQEAGHPVQGG